jgi:hypothetical protein
MTKIWLDTETVGLCGPVKLIQFAIDEGPVQMITLLKGWEADVEVRAQLHKLYDLIDKPDTVLTCFNSAFDLFVLYKLKHRLYGHEYDSPERPVMPFKCKVLDLQIPAMLKSPLAPFAFSRSGGKSVALLRRIPVVAQEIVANRVAEILKPLLPQSFELGVGIHKVAKQPNLVTLSFNVKGRLSLKGLMAEYGLPTLKLAECWPLPEKSSESPWLPYPIPNVHDPIEAQCDEVLRGPKDSAFYRYSELDIIYLKVLYEKLNHPEPDYNSACVANIAYLRYYGFDLDFKALEEAKYYYGRKVAEIEQALQGINLRSSTDRLALLQPHFPIIASTAKKVLKVLAEEDSEGGRLCKMIMDYGPARQRLLQIEKVMECRTGKAHPSLRVMGTATNRNAGEGGFNWQGVSSCDEVLGYELIDNDLGDIPEQILDEEFEQASEEIEQVQEQRKEKVGLRHAILTPCVGDWASFEVRIAAKVYNDENLQRDLQAGMDMHTMALVTSHPKALAEKLTYEEADRIYNDKEHPRHTEIVKWRKGMKAVVFGIFYFASMMKVAEVLNIPDHEAQVVLDRFYNRWPGIQRYRTEIERRFITADTEHWSKGSVARMDTLQADLTGFERRWEFEKSVAVALWGLGQTNKIKTGLVGTVTRTAAKGPQTIDNAIVSACLGSAIAIQAAVSRQAGNMPVQATGSSINKMLQAKLWDELRVPTLSIHDELFPPHHPNYVCTDYAKCIDSYVESVQELVPMLAFDYSVCTKWSDK